MTRELEFLFPFPELVHPRLGDSAKGRVAIERGFVKGYVDLVFEADGLVYFGDWKSDVLSAYDGAALGEHVRAHYRLQAHLYAMALVKMLGTRNVADYEARFGGMLYCFVRGMTPAVPGSGASFARPTWDELRAFEEALARGGSAGVERFLAERP